MSQASVEQILGRLLTDAAFRQLFFSATVTTALRQYPLTNTEQEALLISRSTLSAERLQDIEVLLNPAICRASLRVNEPARSI